MIIRVRFGKEGALRFIGHLDVLRTFQKIFRRAEIPMVYSQGFSPHPIMSFALPLGVGLSSEGEYLDAEIEEEMTTDEILSRLRAATSDELPVYAVRILPEKAGNAMASVGRAAYRLEIPAEYASAIAAAAEMLLAESSHIISKKTKTQTVSFDLRPCIYELACPLPDAENNSSSCAEPCPLPDAGEGGCRRQPGEGGLHASLFMTLAAGSKANVKPELVWEELSRAAALPDGAKPLAIRRLDLMTEDGTPLGDIGE